MSSNEFITKQITKDTRITASKWLWESFQLWMTKRGQQALSEGLRAAMVQCIESDPECQAKSSEAIA